MNITPTSSGLTIRPSVLADLPILYDMVRRFSVELGTETGLSATAEDWGRDGFGANPRFSTVVAEDAGGLFGLATWTEFYLTDLGRTIYFVQQLYVEPTRRRQGIGRTLMGYIAALAERNGIPMVQLGVLNNPLAKSLYQRIGFQRAVGYTTYVLFGTALAEAAAAALDLLTRLG